MPILILHAMIAGLSVLSEWLSEPLKKPAAALAQTQTVFRWVALTRCCSTTDFAWSISCGARSCHWTSGRIVPMRDAALGRARTGPHCVGPSPCTTSVTKVRTEAIREERAPRHGPIRLD